MHAFEKKHHRVSPLPPRRSAGPSEKVSAGKSLERPLLHLQRTIGNQAVQRLLRAEQSAAESSLFLKQRNSGRAASTPRPDARHTASEHEADRVAETVAGMPEPRAGQEVQSMGGPRVSRFDRQQDASGRIEPGFIPSIVHEVLRSPGRPIDPATRAYMEPRFERDFSQVRVHTDARAAKSAEAVNAKAYTVGQDVVFGQGQYMPQNEGGRRLLAHELTHVVQQRREGSPTSLPAASTVASAAGWSRQGVPVIAMTGLRLARRPRSLSMSLNPRLLDDQELEHEIHQIRLWLMEHPESSFEADRLREELTNLELEAHRRTMRILEADVDDLKRQITGILEDLQSDFNFEMNSLQNNLTIVGEVANLEDIPEANLEDILAGELVSAGLAAIPNPYLSAGLGILVNVHSKYQKAQKAAEAAQKRNEVRRFVAHSAQELENRSAVFAWFHDEIEQIAESGEAAIMLDTLDGLREIEQRPLSDYIEEGERYRVALHKAFITRRGKLKEAQISSRLSVEIQEESPTPTSRNWLDRVTEDAEPFLHAMTHRSWRGGRDITLVRFCNLAEPYLENLFTPLPQSGGGFTPTSLWVWWKLDDDARSEVRPPPERDIITWISTCRW